jgi:hypothetical protein
VSLEYHIDADESLITVKVKDGLRPGDMELMAAQLFDDPMFVPDMAQLLDFRHANIELPDDHAKLLTRYLLKKYNPAIDGNIAVVVDPDLTPNDTALMFRIACSLERAELFEDFEMAVKWLAHKWRSSLSAHK